MTAPIQSGRSVDAVNLPTRSAAGTRFEQAVARVARIDRPLSPALAQARDPEADVRLLMAPTNEASAEVRRLQRLMQATGDAAYAPKLAMAVQELDYRSTLAAKALGKIGSTIKEIATAA
ncbi:hypothetical protein [Roseateles sp. L2-2]|uniref:hypothetical protein n=1 Tax=Roseateles TaxID=93681 RepID=UPI003D364F11